MSEINPKGLSPRELLKSHRETRLERLEKRFGTSSKGIDSSGEQGETDHNGDSEKEQPQPDKQTFIGPKTEAETLRDDRQRAARIRKAVSPHGRRVLSAIHGQLILGSNAAHRTDRSNEPVSDQSAPVVPEAETNGDDNS